MKSLPRRVKRVLFGGILILRVWLVIAAVTGTLTRLVTVARRTPGWIRIVRAASTAAGVHKGKLKRAIAKIKPLERVGTVFIGAPMDASNQRQRDCQHSGRAVLTIRWALGSRRST